MNKKTYRYAVIMTNAYPGDTRIFISRLLPILFEFYAVPEDFEKESVLNCFNWGSMYPRSEEYILGKDHAPSVELTRDVFGETQYTDEWESSTIKLINFCPPHLNDRVSLEIKCAESFLLTDKGTHQCTIEFETDALKLYDEVLKAISEILKKFKNATIDIVEK